MAREEREIGRKMGNRREKGKSRSTISEMNDDGE
jgi:hypothetical protein